MSSLNVSGLNQGLSKLIQKVAGTGPAGAIGAATPGAIQTLGKIISHATGHHGHKSSQMLQQIQQAVTTALQSAQSSGNPGDPNKTIENAIAQVLQASLSSASGASATTDDLNSTDSGSTSQEDFFQTLKNYGIDGAQFHKDFLSAVQDVASSQGTDPGTILKNTPPGLIINMLG